MARRRAEKDGGPGLTPEGRCRCALPNGPADRIRQPAPYPLCSPYIHTSRERKSLAIFSCIFGHYFLRATHAAREHIDAGIDGMTPIGQHHIGWRGIDLPELVDAIDTGRGTARRDHAHG